MKSETDIPPPPWDQRYAALGRSQARYLWILLALSVFFLALDAQVRATRFPVISEESRFGLEPHSLDVPFVPIPLSIEVIRIFGPVIILVLLQATLGTLFAAKTAVKHLRTREDDPNVEAFDHHPNVIDMAVYHTDKPGRLFSVIACFSYPTYLTLHSVIAVFLLCSSVRFAPDSNAVPRPVAILMLILAVGVGTFVVKGLFTFWKGRVRLAFGGRSAA